MPRQSSATNAAERAATNLKRVVGENIKAHRIALDLSQEELAEKFGVSRAAVSQYEIGAGEVNAGDLPRLAEILGMSLPQFFQVPPEPYVAPKGPDFQWMLGQVTHAQGGTARSHLPQRSLVRSVNSLDPPWTTEEAALESERPPQGEVPGGEVMAQFSLLTPGNQDLVQRLIRALLEAPSAPRRAGAKRVKRRIKAKENR